MSRNKKKRLARMRKRLKQRRGNGPEQTERLRALVVKVRLGSLYGTIRRSSARGGEVAEWMASEEPCRALARLVGYPETERLVESHSADTIPDVYCHEHVCMRPGDVAFVEVGAQVWRVECVVVPGAYLTRHASPIDLACLAALGVD